MVVPQSFYARSRGLLGRTYDVSPYGQRFLMIKEDEETGAGQEFIVVLNYYENTSHFS